MLALSLSLSDAGDDQRTLERAVHFTCIVHFILTPTPHPRGYCYCLHSANVLLLLFFFFSVYLF